MMATNLLSQQMVKTIRLMPFYMLQVAKPNTANIGLENTDITTNERGAIVVNDTCESSVPGVYAVGDVNGGPSIYVYFSR